MNSYQFFLKHAGYSYDPQTQSPMQGRIQCARRLAAAERKARDAGYYFYWAIDPHTTSADFGASLDNGEIGAPWQLWYCVCYKPGNEPMASLGGIDFGRDGEPWGAPYRRVVEAELALEALEQLEVQNG